jgi:DNA-binding response OmpR family regulator
MVPRVLIVDDDLNIRTLLNRFMQRKGFEVVLAEDGLEGVELAKKVHPDLIVLDVVMPRMDGLTAGRLIKAYKPLSRVPIIFLTAACADEEICMAEEAGAEVYITKPFDMRHLGRVMGELLSMPIETSPVDLR